MNKTIDSTFTTVSIINKIRGLLQGQQLIIDGRKFIIGFDSDDNFQLAQVVFNETKQEEMLLSVDIDFSTFLNMLAK